MHILFVYGFAYASFAPKIKSFHLLDNYFVVWSAAAADCRGAFTQIKNK